VITAYWASSLGVMPFTAFWPKEKRSQDETGGSHDA